jgi:branched-chain amino acid transport system permease protein
LSYSWVFEIFFSGVVLGGIYALMSTGVTVVWGTVGILNFAQGAFITWSAYVALVFLSSWGLGYGYAIPAVILFGFALGIVSEVLLFKPLRDKPNSTYNYIYASAGIGIAMETVALLVFGPRRNAVPPILYGNIRVFGSIITEQNLVVIFVSSVTLLAFWVFLKKNRYGIAMRAVEQDMEAARLVGINLETIYLLTLGLGSVMAAVCGILIGPIYYLWPAVGDIPELKSFIIVVFGGLGSIRGTVLASFILGIVEAVAGFVFGLGWALPAMFTFMMVILIVKPTGLLGKSV